MRSKHYFIMLTIIMITVLTSSCSKPNVMENSSLDNSDWTDKLTLSSTDEAIPDNTTEEVKEETSDIDILKEETSINIVPDENSNDNEATDLSVSISMNILSSENMPLATDTLIYKGSDMSYAAYITNTCSFTADITFFIIINGYLQPFTLEGSDEETYSANYVFEAGEENS